MNQLVYRDCKKCGMRRVPHRVMENRRDSPMICEGCGATTQRRRK